MSRNLKGLGIVLLFLIMLVSPKAVFAGASEGLLLWFQIILPTLFPFLLVTNLLLVTGNMHLINAPSAPSSPMSSVSLPTAALPWSQASYAAIPWAPRQRRI